MKVVVTGMGVVCSIAGSVPEFAVALREGRCGIGPVPGDGDGGPRLAATVKGFSFAGAVAALTCLPEELRQGAARAAHRSPEALQMDLVSAMQAFGHAGLHENAPPADRMGLVVAGHNLSSGYVHDMVPKYQDHPEYLPASFAIQYMDTDRVGRLSQVLGIKGEGYTVGGASASGNVGIVNGSRLVEAGAVDLCLVVGATTDLSPMEKRGFATLGAVAGAGTDEPERVRCRPFDERHEGFVPGQGSACVVLESEASARARGAEVLAELAGYDLKLDANSLPDPNEDGEAKVMTGAMEMAGVEPGQIDYVNAHATATPLGDEIEVRALGRVFGPDIGKPWVNSTKGLVGHCMCAAGVVEAVASIIQLRDGFVHPNLNLRRPIDDGCRFVRGAAQPADIQYALSNSFGFGGFNTSIVLRRPSHAPGTHG
ncbi:beta-ketoacyl synthase N-terminal-like domain-containing protein [Sphaerisporangium sp. B11E5]|uniref:beta-ketoacyl synthase N-terminal-like domain-containing protein n=1 Tax=Sphaerisporangium sp. B11E5 TaxID=3153563 RepID=UPI00325C9892